MGAYTLQSGDGALGRLALLARVHRQASAALLERLPLASGASFLELGCGIGDVARMAAERGARVVALDLDERAIAAARAELASFPNVTLRVASADDLDERGFDVVYARCLLSHLPSRAGVLDAMVAAAKHGGVVAVEDIDFSGAFCDPPCAAFDRYGELYTAVVRARGGDPTLGRSLGRMLASRGLSDVRVEIAQPAFLAGEAKSMARMTLEHLRESLVLASLATHEEIDGLARELEAFERAPGSLVAMPRVGQAWGVR